MHRSNQPQTRWLSALITSGETWDAPTFHEALTRFEIDQPENPTILDDTIRAHEILSLIEYCSSQKDKLGDFLSDIWSMLENNWEISPTSFKPPSETCKLQIITGLIALLDSMPDVPNANKCLDVIELYMLEKNSLLILPGLIHASRKFRWLIPARLSYVAERIHSEETLFGFKSILEAMIPENLAESDTCFAAKQALELISKNSKKDSNSTEA